MKCLNSKIITIFICLQLALFPSLVFAANLGGWSMSNPVAQGASVVYNGTKKVIIDGKDYIKKGTAKITPPASSVAKVLARGAAAYALSVAVEELLGSVDWVLDPANNQIVYTPRNDPANDPANDPTVIFYYTMTIDVEKQSFYSVQDACDAWLSYAIAQPTIVSWMKLPAPNLVAHGDSCRGYGGAGNWTGNTFATAQRVENPAYDPNASTETDNRPKSIPLDVVAAQVISNAESGDTNAQVATTAAAADIVAEAEKDNVKARPIAQQLEASSTTKPADEALAEKANEATGTQTKNPTKPDTTDLKLEFPVFCNWAPTICEAAQVVISFPTKVQGWVDAVALAWSEFWEEPNLEKDKESIDVEDKELTKSASDFDSMYMNFGGQCPSVDSYDVTVGSITQKLTFDLTPLCNLATTVRPAIIALAYLSAIAIVSSAIRDS